jgi:hypothetical protein
MVWILMVVVMVVVVVVVVVLRVRNVRHGGRMKAHHI